MRPLPFLLAAVAFGPACIWVLDYDPPGDPDPGMCHDLSGAFAAEAAEIRACTEDAECGLVLTGTSCGCTRNWVARSDAEPGLFYALMDAATAAGCDLGLESTCDCPETYGYACVDHQCTWDYEPDAPEPLPDCSAEDGDPYGLSAATLSGDTLTATVVYSGGCVEHSFDLCWPDQSFMESDPVQARLDLLHDDPGDPCDGVVSEDRDFDLSPLKEAWQAAYHATSGEIVVHLHDFTFHYVF